MTISISALTQSIQAKTGKRSPQQRKQLLRSAKIIYRNGYYSKEFFSSDTVEKDKKAGVTEA